MKTLNVLYQSDNNYAVFMGVSITSLLINCKNIHLNIYVIDIGISEDNKIKLRTMVENHHQKIFYLNADTLIKQLQKTILGQYAQFRKNNTSFCKLFFCSLLESEIDKILYMDCDTIIVDDLSPILNIDMSEYSIGMVQDALISVKMKRQLQFNCEDKYYNSGVILFNVKHWKKCKCAERILEHASKGNVYGTVDQDYLNVVLKKEIKTLDINYNLQLPYYTYSIKIFSHIFQQDASYYSLQEIKAGVKHPVIIHFLRFCGESPWNKNSVHPATKLFDKYLSISPWKNYKKLPSSKSNIFKVEKLLYKVLPRPIFCLIYKIVHDYMILKSNLKAKKINRRKLQWAKQKNI